MTTPDDETPPRASRSIELEIEVPGTPEQVWRAIATGPGISAWFVPTQVEEHEGGAVEMDFGSGMAESGRVTRWDPPTAIAYGAPADEHTPGALAYEFLVQAQDGGGAVVRLVNSGFGFGDDWDGQYDGMTEGWKLFLHNLRLHLTHFAGEHCESIVVNGIAPGPRATAWKAYTAALGVAGSPSEGERVTTAGGGAPRLSGIVDRTGGTMVTLLTDEPARGVAFVAAEGDGEQVALSLYGYFYGPSAAAVVGTDGPAWAAWMGERFPMPPPA